MYSCSFLVVYPSGWRAQHGGQGLLYACQHTAQPSTAIELGQWAVFKLVSKSQRAYQTMFTSTGNFHFAVFDFSGKFCLQCSIYVKTVLPLTLLPIRKPRAKQERKCCLSLLSIQFTSFLYSAHFCREVISSVVHLATDSRPCGSALQVHRHFCGMLGSKARAPHMDMSGSNDSSNSQLKQEIFQEKVRGLSIFLVLLL